MFESVRMSKLASGNSLPVATESQHLLAAFVILFAVYQKPEVGSEFMENALKRCLLWCKFFVAICVAHEKTRHIFHALIPGPHGAFILVLLRFIYLRELLIFICRLPSWMP